MLASTVGPGLAIAAVAVFVFVVAVGMWVVRVQARQYPRDMDRTWLQPGRDVTHWMVTKFTWLGEGRG